MFESLAAGSARRSFRPLAAALGFHALLVLTAVELRPQPVPPKRIPIAGPIWIAPSVPSTASDPGVAGGERARSSSGEHTVPRAPSPVSAGVAGAPIGPIDVGRESAGFPSPVLPETAGAGGISGIIGPAVRQFDEGVLAPELLDTEGMARSLALLGLAGSATLRCVVDRNGRVISATIHVIDSTNAEVAVAARSALLRARYRPGRVGGETVGVEIRQRFTFTRP